MTTTSVRTFAKLTVILVILWVLFSLASYSLLVVPRQRRFDVANRRAKM